MPDFGALAGVGQAQASAGPSTDDTALADAVAALQAEKKAKKKSGGLFGAIKSAAGAVGKAATEPLVSALHVLDKGRAGVVATGVELGDLARNVSGKDKTSHFSLTDWKNEVGNNIGAGQVIQQSFPDANKWVKRGGGLLLDTASDPTNAVTLGRGEVANAGLKAAGQVVGDDAAKQALRAGGVPGLRAVVEQGGTHKLEDVLARGTGGGLGKKSTEEVVQERLAALSKNAKGGLGFGGLRTGIGQDTAERLGAGLKASAVYKDVAPLFRTGAKVEEATGSKGAAEAVTAGLHTAGGARREARALLADSGQEIGKEGYQAIKDHASAAMWQDLAHTAPELVSTEAKAGWKPILDGAGYMHPAVKEALDKAVSTPPSEYMKALDTAMSALKQVTVFGPQNAIQHDSKRFLFNHLAAAMYGGVKDPATWKESWAARKAITSVVKDGAQVDAKALVEKGLTEDAAKRAESMYHKILTDNPLYEVSGEDAAKKSKGVLGTRTAAHAAEVDGEWSRGAVYLKGLDDGLSPTAAATKARQAMLDFSNEGLTKFERDKLQRIVFFYKFPRRAIPAGVKFAFEHPGETAVATRLGAGIGTGARNQFGQKIGLQPDTPLEAAFGSIGEIAKNPLDFALGNVTPPLRAVIDPNARHLKDVVPPYGQALSIGKTLSQGTAGLEKIAPKFVGLQPGQDYEGIKSAAKESTAEGKAQVRFDTRKKAGKSPTKKDRLSALAAKAQVPNPYSSTEQTLLQGLITAGVKSDTIRATLHGTDSKQGPGGPYSRFLTP